MSCISYISLVFILLYSVEVHMGWRLQLVGSLKLQVSTAKEPYKRDYILQKRLIILWSLLIEATPQYCSSTQVYLSNISYTSVMKIQMYQVYIHGTGWRRLIGSLELQIIFHQRATKYRSLLRKMSQMGSYESSPPCIYMELQFYQYRCMIFKHYNCISNVLVIYHSCIYSAVSVIYLYIF